MRRQSSLWQAAGIVGAFGLLSGCGGGGDGAPGASAGTAGGSAMASGTVTGFGSVFVNGKRFETTAASFVVDGQPGSQGDLKLGMTVVVSGTVNGGQRSANSVRQRDAVEGLVQ